VDLYQAEWCPHSHRVRQRLTELGQNWHAHQVEADRENRDEMESAVGTREIPTLVTDDGKTLTGTEAILPFLDETFEPRPDAKRHRARARAEVPYFEENRAG
jgi:glutathione S-transferase